MSIIFGKLAATLIIFYIAMTFGSAYRMYRVHAKYVHVEFAARKWRTFGEWAPRQYRRLNALRGLCLLSLVAWGVLLYIEARKSG